MQWRATADFEDAEGVAAFLDFAEPLAKMVPPAAGPEALNAVLILAAGAWNLVLHEDGHALAEPCTRVRREHDELVALFEAIPWRRESARELVEKLKERKRNLFAEASGRIVDAKVDEPEDGVFDITIIGAPSS
jgi:hypothetical protein